MTACVTKLLFGLPLVAGICFAAYEVCPISYSAYLQWPAVLPDYTSLLLRPCDACVSGR